MSGTSLSPIDASNAHVREDALNPATLIPVLALIGFTAVIAQIVFMRELMIVFCGNEMSLGLMLASWLLWTALGSGVLARWTTQRHRPRLVMAGLEVAVAFSFPFGVVLVRASKAVFQTIPGEILGPGPMAITSLIALSSFCVFSGALFAAGSRLCAEEASASRPAATSRVYLLEAVGSGLGGVLASLVLIRYMQPFAIAVLLALLNLLAAAALGTRGKLRRRILMGLLLAVFAFLVFPFGCRWLEATSLRWLWHGYELIATRNSVYGNLAVVQTTGTRSLFENGLVTLNVPDPLAAEEAVHFALLQHSLPRSLLLIGGGVNGSVSQALQYSSLERLDYVELDPAVIRLTQEYFPSEWARLSSDPRVRVHTVDGRLFLKTTQFKFDVIIINLPDPQTAQLNRFYTVEFFREAARGLTPAGVFSFQLKGAEDYISPELGEFLGCIHKTLSQVFPEVVTIPGDTIHFLASPQRGSLTVDPAELIARLRARHVATIYVREYYLPYRLMPDRMLDLESQIRPQGDTRINRDFGPIAYYFDVALWSKQFSGGYRQMFERLGHLPFRLLAGVIGLGCLALLAFVRLGELKQDRLWVSTGFSVAVMGFTLIALEMLLLLGFQAIYGYVYQELAVIIAGFMLGMALGSWRGLRSSAKDSMRREQRDLRHMVGLQILALLSPVAVCVLLRAFAGIENPTTIFLASEIIFPVLAILGGLLGGYQFPIASRIFFAASRPTRGSGTLYALDLFGACVGALVLSSYLVPVFGFQQTAWFVAEINLAAVLLMSLFGWSGQPEGRDAMKSASVI